jgi:hypothetical protein
LADLNGLIGNVRESKTIEYKRVMPAITREEKLKLLAGVSSFANTTGGDLLIGVEAEEGLATGVTGIVAADPDSEKLRLIEILRDNIEPRIPGVEIIDVPCPDGRSVFLIRTLRSWVAPHRVTIDNRFYGRNSAGKYPLDVGELRQAFLLGDAAGARMRSFRADRLMKIAAGETPLPMREGACIAVHVVAIPPIHDATSIDVVEALAEGHVMPLPFGRQSSANQLCYNLDGCATFVGNGDPLTPAYAQLFRTGAVEGVLSLDIDENNVPYLHGPTFEPQTIAAVRNYIDLLVDLQMGPPFAVFVSFAGMKGCKVRYGAPGGGFYQAGPLRDDMIALPEVVLIDASTDVRASLAPVFSAIWNAFGLRRGPH